MTDTNNSTIIDALNDGIAATDSVADELARIASVMESYLPAININLNGVRQSLEAIGLRMDSVSNVSIGDTLYNLVTSINNGLLIDMPEVNVNLASSPVIRIENTIEQQSANCDPCASVPAPTNPDPIGDIDPSFPPIGQDEDEYREYLCAAFQYVYDKNVISTFDGTFSYAQSIGLIVTLFQFTYALSGNWWVSWPVAIVRAAWDLIKSWIDDEQFDPIALVAELQSLKMPLVQVLKCANVSTAIDDSMSLLSAQNATQNAVDWLNVSILSPYALNAVYGASGTIPENYVAQPCTPCGIVSQHVLEFSFDTDMEGVYENGGPRTMYSPENQCAMVFKSWQGNQNLGFKLLTLTNKLGFTPTAFIIKGIELDVWPDFPFTGSSFSFVIETDEYNLPDPIARDIVIGGAELSQAGFTSFSFELNHKMNAMGSDYIRMSVPTAAYANEQYVYVDNIRLYLDVEL